MLEKDRLVCSEFKVKKLSPTFLRATREEGENGDRETTISVVMVW